MESVPLIKIMENFQTILVRYQIPLVKFKLPLVKYKWIWFDTGILHVYFMAITYKYQKMNDKELMKLLNGQEPIAIVRYYEWTKISRSYVYPRYLLLRLNTSCKDIDEVDIPENIISLIIPYLKKFTEVIRRNDGTVWERMDFREKAKELVPFSKIDILITK